MTGPSPGTSRGAASRFACTRAVSRGEPPGERAATGIFRIDRGDCYGIMVRAMMRYWVTASLSKQETER
jgi:hypothetical protein